MQYCYLCLLIKSRRRARIRLEESLGYYTIRVRWFAVCVWEILVAGMWQYDVENMNSGFAVCSVCHLGLQFTFCVYGYFMGFEGSFVSVLQFAL